MDLGLVWYFWEHNVFHWGTSQCGENIQDATNGWNSAGEAARGSTRTIGSREGRTGSAHPRRGKEVERNRGRGKEEEGYRGREIGSRSNIPLQGGACSRGLNF